MPENKVRLPKGYYHSKNLNTVARHVVDLAFSIGGSPGKYFNAKKCNYVFPDGTPCFNEERGDHNIDCPLCHGNGAYYENPVDVPIILSDSLNPLMQDKYGARFDDRLTLTVPIYINPSIVEINRKGDMYVIKDKLAVYDHSSNLWGIFVVTAEPNEPFISGPLFHQIEVTSQYTQNQDDNYTEPKLYYKFNEKEVFTEVNKDILTVNGPETADYPEINNENVVVTDSGVRIESPNDLEDDWS